MVVNTILEHNSNELPWRLCPGVSTVRLPVDREDFLDLNELKAALRAHAAPRTPDGSGSSSSP